MKRWRVLVAVALILCATVPAAEAESIIGLSTSNQLFTFDSATPAATTAPTAVTGLLGGTLVGIDVRPIDGQLVGVGDVGGVGTIYSINPTTAVATPLKTGLALIGSVFGVDFDPVANELRIAGLNGQNLRILDGGAGAVIVDTALNPGTPHVVGAAYSNNFAGASSTTLYDIDNQGPVVGLVLQTQGSPGGSPVSPNTGTLFSVGPLGIITGDPSVNPIGFDISGVTGTAFATSISNLYTIDLSNGAATLVGQIGPGPDSFAVRDIAVQVVPTQTVPEPGSLMLFGVAMAGLLGYQWRRRRLAPRAE